MKRKALKETISQVAWKDEFEARREKIIAAYLNDNSHSRTRSIENPSRTEPDCRNGYVRPDLDAASRTDAHVHGRFVRTGTQRADPYTRRENTSTGANKNGPVSRIVVWDGPKDVWEVRSQELSSIKSSIQMHDGNALYDGEAQDVFRALRPELLAEIDTEALPSDAASSSQGQSPASGSAPPPSGVKHKQWPKGTLGKAAADKPTPKKRKNADDDSDDDAMGIGGFQRSIPSLKAPSVAASSGSGSVSGSTPKKLKLSPADKATKEFQDASSSYQALASSLHVGANLEKVDDVKSKLTKCIKSLFAVNMIDELIQARDSYQRCLDIRQCIVAWDSVSAIKGENLFTPTPAQLVHIDTFKRRRPKSKSLGAFRLQ